MSSEVSVASLASAAEVVGDLADMVSDLADRVGDRPEIVRARREMHDRLRVAVLGRPGTGRDTLARALRDRLDVAPIGPGDDHSDADLWVYVVVGWPRAADHGVLRRLPADRTVVVLGKADTLGSWEEAHATAHECAAAVRRPVYPVMPLLGCVDISDDEFALLVSMVRTDEPMPSMAAHFIVGGRDEQALRTGMLRRLDQFGILCALDLIDEADLSGRPIDREQLITTLRDRSGVNELRSPLEAMIPAARARRREVLLGNLDRLAAAGVARDEIEHALAGVDR